MKWSKSKSIIALAIFAVSAVVLAGPFKDRAGRIFQWFIGGVEVMKHDGAALRVDTITNLAGTAGPDVDIEVSGEPILVAEYMTATTTTGTPAAGEFYSEVLGRSPMLDLAKIPTGKFGIERVRVEGLKLVPGETGPGGELVYETTNDTGNRFRAYGRVPFGPSGNGDIISITNAGAGFLEIVFYGTGVNAVIQAGGNGTTLNLQVDGNAISAVSTSGLGSILQSRSYDVNNPIELTSGLALGVHTLRVTPSGDFMQFYGFEVVNDSTSVDIPAGSIIAGATKYTTTATTDDLTTFENSTQNGSGTVTDATVGGHVSRYFDTDGTIKKDINYADSSQLNLGSADHSNEEVVQRFNWKEFGVGRTDDFSTVTTGTSDRAFTLDDGTTSLIADSVATGDATIGNSFAYVNSASGFVKLTFIGTGLDVVFGHAGVEASTTRNIEEVSIDGGASVGSISFQPIAANTIVTKKIVSGLPFGTHTVRFLNNAGANSMGFSDFIIYAPKKPVLTAEQVEIDSYYKVADFTFDTNVASPAPPSKGVIRKVGQRERVYGTGFSISSGINLSRIDGTQVSFTSTSMEYTFFGTGFDFRCDACQGGAGSVAVDVDGLDLTNSGPGNFPGATIGIGGGGSITYDGQTGTSISATGNIFNQNVSPTGGALFVSGLPLGLHTVTIAHSSGTTYGGAIDIITPTYSYESSLLHLSEDLVGSNSLKSEILIPGATKNKFIAVEGISGFNAGTCGGDGNNICDGVQIPTCEIQSGFDACAVSDGFYVRIGNTVQFSWKMTQDATSSSGTAQLNFANLPFVKSNFPSDSKASGICIAAIATGINNSTGNVFALANTRKLRMNIQNIGTTGNEAMRCNVTYQIP